MARRVNGRAGRDMARLLADFGHDLPTVPQPAPAVREPRLFRHAARAGGRRPGRGWSPAKAPVSTWRMTSDQAPVLWPFISPPGLPPTGAQMGIDQLSGGSFYADPLGWVLRDDVPVTNPNIFAFGKPGRGKSATVKAFILRMMDFGYRTLIVGDPKDEYEKLCRALGVEPFAIGHGLPTRINPLAFGPLGAGWENLPAAEAQRRAAIVFGRWLTLVRGLVGSQRIGERRVPFGPTDEVVVKSALQYLTGYTHGHSRLQEVTIPQLWQLLDNPTDELVGQCRYESTRHFLDETRLLRDALGQLVSGALAGLFDDHTSIDVNWQAPIQSLSLSRLEPLGEEAVGIALTCLNSWGRGMREMAQPGDLRIVVRDESWKQLRLGPEAVKSFDADLRLSRREFIPGEKLGTTAYKRRMPVTTLAAAVPAATAKVGDRLGIHLGETSGTSTRVVTWEPWEMTERGEESGLAVLCAGLGGGKSTAGGNIIYRSLMQGVPWTVLDPSGRLTALCRLPDLAGRAEAIDLLEAPPGVLNTYRVIAEPVLEHYHSELDWKVAKEHAAETRRMLTSNVLRSMLPRQMQDHVLTEVALLRAVGKVHATHTSSTTYVVDELASLDGDPELCRHAGYMADFLREAAKTGHGRLIFASGYYLDKRTETPLLTVYSLRGLALPDESTPYSDDLDERLSMCVLYLAAWLTQRAMYSGDVHGRKGIFLDEAWALSTFGSGRRFIDRASRDSRKHNTRVLLASQNPSDLLRLDLANLVSAAFIGRLTDEEAQRDALRFLPGVPEGVGYEAIFGTLSRPSREGKRGAREFVFSDGTGAIERIRMDMSAHPELLEALSTTADPEKARNRVARQREEAAARSTPESVSEEPCLDEIEKTA